MSETATAPRPKTADASAYKQAQIAILDGVSLSGIAEVRERGPVTFNGQTNEQLVLSSNGFIHKFYGREASEYRNWPFKGDIVRFSCPVMKGPDGGYKLSNPTSVEVLASTV